MSNILYSPNNNKLSNEAQPNNKLFAIILDNFYLIDNYFNL
jgi:hypothetical protein